MRKLALILSAPGTPKPEVGTGFWKLSDQLLMVPLRPVVAVLDHQHPGSLSAHPRKGRQRHLGIERGEERRSAVLDRGRRVVVEDRIGEIRRLVAAAAHAGGQGDRAHQVPVQVEMFEAERQVGVVGIGQVDRDPQAADPRGGGVSLDQ